MISRYFCAVVVQTLISYWYNTFTFIQDAILEEDAVSKKQLQINDMGKTNKLRDDELDAFVNEAEAVEDDEGVDHPDVGVSLSTGSTEVEVCIFRV